MDVQGNYEPINKLTQQSIGRSINPPVIPRINQSTSQSTSQLIHQSFHESINPSVFPRINQSTSLSTNQSIHQSFHESINPPINPPVNPPRNQQFTPWKRYWPRSHGPGEKRHENLMSVTDPRIWRRSGQLSANDTGGWVIISLALTPWSVRWFSVIRTGSIAHEAWKWKLYAARKASSWAQTTTGRWTWTRSGLSLIKMKQV